MALVAVCSRCNDSQMPLFVVGMSYMHSAQQWNLGSEKD